MRVLSEQRKAMYAENNYLSTCWAALFYLIAVKKGFTCALLGPLSFSQKHKIQECSYQVEGQVKTCRSVHPSVRTSPIDGVTVAAIIATGAVVLYVYSSV